MMKCVAQSVKVQLAKSIEAYCAAVIGEADRSFSPHSTFGKSIERTP